MDLLVRFGTFLTGQLGTWLTLSSPFSDRFISIVSLPFAILCVFIIPKPREAVFSVPVNGKETDGTTLTMRKAKFDWGGTFFQIASIALTVYGLTSANYKGWKKAETLAPLLIGIALFPCFFLWEARMDPIDALVSRSTLLDSPRRSAYLDLTSLTTL
jgi:hypothetical protein